MKKALISLGLTLLLLTIPVYADEEEPTDTEPSSSDAFEAATGRVGGALNASQGASTDAAGNLDDTGEAVETADTSNANEILDRCGLWGSFQAETNIDQKNECEETINTQIDNGTKLLKHPLFNPTGEGTLVNGSSGCCYSNNNIKDFDANNNCELDESSENCQLNLRALSIKKSCICSDNPNHEICNQVFRCEFGNDNATTYTAFESEYFDVTDPNKGLYTSGQKGDLVAANNDQGPIFTIVNRALNIMVGLASTVALVIIIIGAYILITAQGGENQLEKGKNAIIYSILGLVFILTSYTIVRLVQSILF